MVDPKELFDYEDGTLYWKSSVKNSYAGRNAGRVGTRGYVQVKISGKMYLAHHLIWWIFHGAKPEYIDHINGNPTDNRIENLRECTLSQNQYNSKLSIANKSGEKNVFWNTHRHQWVVKIGQTIFGRFPYYEFDLAVKCAKEARSFTCEGYNRE